MKLPTLTLALALLLSAFTLRAEDGPSPAPSATQAVKEALPLVTEGTARPAALPPNLRPREKTFSDTYQFIFFATLEGLYREGVSDDDVAALLAAKKNGGYLNFICACPICMPTLKAITTYRLRPRIDNSKIPTYQTDQRTFGDGLPKEVSAALRSKNTKERLEAVNRLVAGWIAWRMDHSSLTAAQKKEMTAKLKKDREDGIRLLRTFSEDPKQMEYYAPGYASGKDECAICNAALQMPLKLKE